jgi:DNA polymerase
VLGQKTSITAVRGERIVKEGRAYYPTFHPAALLRDPSKKRPVWHDFQRIARDYRLILEGAPDDEETEPWPEPDGGASR